MQAQKTVVARLWKLTHRKSERLDEVFKIWRCMLRLKTYQERRCLGPFLHSCYARNCFKVKSPNSPIYLAHYDFKLKDTGNKLARWFARLPYKPHEPIWVPLRMSSENEELLRNAEIKDSMLVKDKGIFKLHITVAKELELNHTYSSVLGVDLGERVLATTVLLRQDSALAQPPKFYGKNARGVRRHYAWLRKRLGEKKLLRVIKKVKHAEKRKINTLCHQISRAIVNEAKAHNAIIMLGDLKGIRKRAKGRRFNRIVSNMPYYKLSKMIEYKALWEGIHVAYGSEGYTSQECHLCHSRGKRLTQGLFICSVCGHQWNADYNGAYNLAKKFERDLGYMPLSGADCEPALNHARSVEAPYFSGGVVHAKRFWDYMFQNGAVGSPLLREA